MVWLQYTSVESQNGKIPGELQMQSATRFIVLYNPVLILLWLNSVVEYRACFTNIFCSTRTETFVSNGKNHLFIITLFSSAPSRWIAWPHPQNKHFTRQSGNISGTPRLLQTLLIFHPAYLFAKWLHSTPLLGVPLDHAVEQLNQPWPQFVGGSWSRGFLHGKNQCNQQRPCLCN